MASVLELLMSQPSLAEQAMQLQQMSGGSPGGGGPSGAPGNLGSVNNLMTRRGVTMTTPAMQSLLDIARQSDLMPGARELGQITDSYRTRDQQAAAYAAKPGIAAPPGSSYHEKGLAFDAGWWSDHPELVRLLEQAGWNRFDPSGEPWHWSFGVTG